MLSATEAMTLILENTQLKTPAWTALANSLGLVLAQDIITAVDLPGFNNSAMDGFALRASDLSCASPQNPVRLALCATIGAGCVFKGAIGKGQCAQIMTGAVMPKGADAVVMKEDVQVHGRTAIFMQATVAGENVRFRAEDMRRGEKVLLKGALIGPAQIALIAAQGMARVRTIPKASVGLASTGDELISPGQKLGPGKIYDSNSFMLQALTREAHADGQCLGIVRDNKRSIRQAIARALTYDVAIIAGGVSVGTFDYVKEAFKQEGVKEIFWKIKIKPGMPVFFGTRGKTLVFGVPGNPVSAFVVFDQFIRPALRKTMGLSPIQRPSVQAILEKDISKKPGKTTYVRALCQQKNGQWTVQSAGAQGSHSLKSLVRANALLIVPQDVQKVRAGESVEVQLLP